MPLLAYCLAEAREEISIPPAGVQGLTIQALPSGKLCCFFSQFRADSLAGTTPLREAAIEFSRTLQEFLKQATVIPFRFPTLLGDENELLKHLIQNAVHYEKALARVRGMVQMDIRVVPREAASAKVTSGTEYLRARAQRDKALHAVAAQFRCAGAQYIREWRERETSHALHCYALLARQHMDAYLSKTQNLSIASEFTARVSGPWPPAEFLQAYEQRKT
jgi:Gas vesicle synthesis protein GvpL/GvpF